MKLYTEEQVIEMINKCQATGLDSGAGVKLRKDKDVHQGILEFLLARHDDAVECFTEYRKVLGKHFKKEFHVLDL
jgi:hypothetical protein